MPGNTPRELPNPHLPDDEDLIEGRRAEEATARLAAVVESSDDAIVSKDLNGIITSWNKGAEHLFGYTESEMIGKPVALLIPPDRSDEEPSILERIRRGERIDHYETVRRRKDGSLLDISVTISPVRDTAGRVIGAAKIARDITGRKMAEAAQQDADRRKDEFLAMLAHELRGPLAPIRNCLQIVGMRGADPTDVDAARAIMERQIAHMTRLIDDLIDVSRISRGKLELRRESTDLTSTVRSVAEATRPFCETMRHELSITLAPPPIYVDADPIRLAQVVANLLNNACKFTDHGGRIELTVQREGEQAIVRVRDSGIGIASDHLPRIFDLFTQIDHSMERSRGGLGIGLSLVKDVVEMHGGTVTAHSAGPGHGSEFVVRLPVLVESPTPTVPELTKAPQTARTHLILVVDDNRDSARSLAMVLKAKGHSVHTAHDGVEAVEEAMRLRPEMILLDLGLPRLNGFEAAQRIRKQPGGDTVKLVALTGWGQKEDRRRSKEAGFNAHLVKPIATEDLDRLIATIGN